MVGYQPKPDDLDYPAKLERLAAAGSPKALPAAPSELVVEATRDDDVRAQPPLVPSPCCCDGLHLFQHHSVATPSQTRMHVLRCNADQEAVLLSFACYLLIERMPAAFNPGQRHLLANLMTY